MRWWKILLALCAVAIALPASAEPVTLKLKFPVGQADKLTITQTMDQTFTSDQIPQPVSQKMSQTQDMTLRVAESDAKKGSVIEFTPARIRSSNNFTGQEKTFDSDKDKDSKEPEAVAMLALLGARMRLSFNPEGKVTQFTGMKEVWETLIKKFPGEEQGLAPFKQGFSDDTMKQMFSGFLSGFIPPKPVSVNDKWTSNEAQNLPGLGVVKLKMEYQLAGVEERQGRKQARVLVIGKGSVEGNFGQPGLKLQIDQVEQRGVIYFDLERGWLADQTLDQTSKGTATVAQAGGKELNLKLEQKMRVEVHSKFGK